MYKARTISTCVHIRGLSALLVSDRWARPKPQYVGRATSKFPRFCFIWVNNNKIINNLPRGLAEEKQKKMKKIRLFLSIALTMSLFITNCGPSADEIFQEGRTHQKNKEYDKAFECYNKAKEQGYDSAYSALAAMYFDGRGVEKNYDKAFEYATIANEKGAGGNYLLGQMYYFGRGVEKNYTKAMEYFKKIEDRVSNALYYIGLMYYYGEGVAQNYNSAFDYFKKADSKEVPRASYYLGVMHYYGEGVDKNNKPAFDYFKKADNKEVSEASYYLGLLHY